MPKNKDVKSSKDVAEHRIPPIAKDVLDVMERLVDGATAALGMPSPNVVNVLASGNTLTNPRALPNLSAITDESRQNLLQIIREPTVARVVARAADGTDKTYFFVRATPQTKSVENAFVASLRSPMGRLASLPVGETFELAAPSGIQHLEIVERVSLKPERLFDEWDAFNSVFEGNGYGPMTVTSLRTLLKVSGAPSAEIDLLEALLAEDRAEKVIFDGIRRNVLKKMGLRDQPILDQYQDEIFRLPIEARIAILGPPGSGKTTTLIKRLGLKLDAEHLAPSERARIERSSAGNQSHSRSWSMFTPTELLKQYVKEAFSRENIAASDYLIHTWADYRREMARNTLGILRTSTSRSGYVLNETLASVAQTTLSAQVDWATEFAQWQAAIYWNEMKEHASNLQVSADASVARLGTQLLEITEARSSEPSRFRAIAALDGEVRDLAARLTAEIDLAVRTSFARHLKTDRNLLDELLAFVATLDDSAEDSDEADLDEDEEPQAPLLGREVAFEAYKQAARSQARAAGSRRQVSRLSRAGKLLNWLGARALSNEEAQRIGQTLQVQTSARAFAGGVRRYVAGVARRYRRYRRECQAQNKWYASGTIEPSSIAPLEVDLLLLTMFRAAVPLIRDPQIAQGMDHPRYSTLKAIRGLFRNQVLADEATDFSPLQLGCMAALSDPAIDAFVACGDFHQRITEWGMRTVAELTWAVPNIQTRWINTTYRHTKELNEFARRIVLLSDPTARAVELPANVDNAGVAPALGVNLNNLDAVAAWLSARITEIERITQGMPSVAVLVNEEVDVVPLAAALNNALSKANLRAVPCSQGQVVGQENDVRVFDIQHIKGLEFEAVFFVDLDRLAEMVPDLFDKYLYVGATRAATYLGLTVRGSALPAKIESARTLVTDSWRSTK